jgi:copper resistance protein B
MRRPALILIPLLLCAPALAQTAPAMPGMAMPGMPGMTMPAAPPSPPAPDAAQPDGPDAQPPAPATDHAADGFYDPALMAAARAVLREEHGGATFTQVMANIAEYQSAPGGGGYRWDGEAWIGGDIDRLVLKSEGDGSRRYGLDDAEVQALYSHAIGPYFDLQAGVRQDVSPSPRTYATAGVEGVLPYWFDVGAAIFVSDKGEVLARLEGLYDIRLTQRLILQPRAELNFAAQDTVQTRTGSGLSDAELGLRLRYEIRREFGPYIGVAYDPKAGKSADYARILGGDPGGLSLVAGIRSWF